MSKYTTGEMAKLCGITVRAVQYYDSRDILVPSELSEGGRRLYSEEDFRRLKIICFLRDMDISIDSIKKILCEDCPDEVVYTLLAQQQKMLEEEIFERKQKLERLSGLRSELKGISHFSVDSIGDIAHIMQNRKKLRRVRRNMILIGILANIIEYATLALWIAKGIWLPFIIGLIPVIAIGIFVSVYYYKNTAYICPHCHTVFKPTFRENFFANHTPKARKLRCPKCQTKKFCIETYGGEK